MKRLFGYSFGISPDNVLKKPHFASLGERGIEGRAKFSTSYEFIRPDLDRYCSTCFCSRWHCSRISLAISSVITLSMP